MSRVLEGSGQSDAPLSTDWCRTHVILNGKTWDGAYTMASKRKKNIPAPLTGEALAQAMVANKKLVRESNEAFDRLRAGERGIPWEEVKRELDAR